jgi:hypothetical protein
MRYRLDVVASTGVDVVRFAGGWLFDRAMAGWDVTVLLTDLVDDPDARPLQILGARVIDLEDALAAVESRPRPQALAAAADLFGCDSRVRQGVLQALDHGVTEVTLWGDLAGRARGERWRGTASAEHGREDVQGPGAGGRGRAARLDRLRRDLPERAAGMPFGRGRSGSRRLKVQLVASPSANTATQNRGVASLISHSGAGPCR